MFTKNIFYNAAVCTLLVIGSAFPMTVAAETGLCPTLFGTLSFGMHSSEVVSLQNFLAADPVVYPEGSVTGFFGALTQKAVIAYQISHGIVSSVEQGAGTVGPRTRAFIANHCVRDSSNNSVIDTTEFEELVPRFAPLTRDGCFANVCGECSSSEAFAPSQCIKRQDSICYLGAVCGRVTSTSSCTWLEAPFTNSCLASFKTTFATSTIQIQLTQSSASQSNQTASTSSSTVQ